MIGQNSLSPTGQFGFTAEEQQLFLSRLWDALAKEVGRYNGIDSTSIAVKKAEDILRSMLFILGFLTENGVSPRRFLAEDLQEYLRRGEKLLLRKKTALRVDWELMQKDLPRVTNAYFSDTVRNISLFFRRYNVYYESHCIPCTMDYWLLCPAPEERMGISFMEAYLSSLQTELDFLACFDAKTAERLYISSFSDYKHSFFNLCEPVLTNAVGLALLGEDVHPLNITPEQRASLAQSIEGLTEDTVKQQLANAVLRMCRQLGISDEPAQDYWLTACGGLAGRMKIAAENGNLSGIFPSILL